MKALRHALLEAARVEHGFGVRGLAPPPGLRRPQQVHGARVAQAADCLGETSPRADAVVSALPGVPVGVVTADCVPILVATEAGAAVAAIHAGWRGLACGVIEAGIEALRAESAGAPRLVAVIGPHIGVCCYEVDEPVLEALAPAFGGELAAALRPARPGHAWLDLGRLARTALLRAGLAPEALGLLPSACTRCDPVRFHSYRREGAAAGRLHHYIAARRTQA
ncbi:MAG TPA: polyphenol oxidase family protein [Myxococcota bacterium]